MKPITKDIFEIVTALIVEKLEGGIVPWRQPWKDLAPPRNFITRRPYRGINLLLLGSLGYPTNEFLTFNQIRDLGGKVSKGEKAHLVVLWLWIDEDETHRMQEVKPKKRPQLRYYHVFNVAQCYEIPKRATWAQPEPVRKDAIELCESIIAGVPHCPKIVHNENEAYYDCAADYINMPKKEVFESLEAYHATLFHELAHSTGHPDRLNRKEVVDADKFGSESYSIEELTAEICSCFLTSFAGIAPAGLTNSVAYIQGWLKRLKNDKKFIVYASAQAQRATDYLLNIHHSEPPLVESLESVES